MVCHKHHPTGSPPTDDMDRLAQEKRDRQAEADSVTLGEQAQSAARRAADATR